MCRKERFTPRMSSLGLLAGLCLLSTSASAEIIKGPYLQNVRTDEITILWQQEGDTAGTVTVPGVGTFSSPSGTLHEVDVTGLSPGTQYGYTVSGDGETDSGTFGTAPSALNDPFVFIALGDTRSNYDDHESVVNAILANETDIGLVINTGDMVASGDSYDDWESFFDAEYPLIKNYALYPTVGNHEESDGDVPSYYYQYLAPPTDLSGTEDYYAFTYANTAFIVLDGHTNMNLLGLGLNSAQSSFLDDRLNAYSSDPTIKHIFVFTHEPPYSSKDGRYGAFWLRNLNSTFISYGVSAIINGHDHYLERGESGNAQGAGMRYYIMGGGGAPLYDNNNESETKPLQIGGLFPHRIYFAQKSLGYMRVSIDNCDVEVQIIDETGTVLDSESWSEGDDCVDTDTDTDTGTDTDADSDTDVDTDSDSDGDGDGDSDADSDTGTDAAVEPSGGGSSCGCAAVGRRQNGRRPGLLRLFIASLFTLDRA